MGNCRINTHRGRNLEIAPQAAAACKEHEGNRIIEQGNLGSEGC